MVQLDEVLFGAFLAGEVPFLELGDRIKAKLDKNIAKSRQSLFAYKGKTYGLPQSLSAMVLYYRTDLFKEMDIDPASLTTWEKLVSTGEKVVKDHGKAMIALDPTYFGILCDSAEVICLARTARFIPTARPRSRCWAGCASRWSPASAWCRSVPRFLTRSFSTAQCSSVKCSRWSVPIGTGSICSSSSLLT